MRWYAGLCVVAGLLFSAGCERKHTTTQVEVKDKLLGGQEVKKTEVTQQGDKTQVKETKTDVNPDGTVRKKKTTVKGDAGD